VTFIAKAMTSSQGFFCDDGCTQGQAYWKVVDKGTCSKSCGSGTQQVDYQCMGKYKNGAEASCIDDNFATVCGTDPSGPQQCNMQPCITYGWAVTGWSVCSHVCGGGLQARNVTCTSSSGTTIIIFRRTGHEFVCNMLC